MFLREHFILVYFFYGLSFFSMGLALLVESGQPSRLALANAMRMLGAFGILHGTHEFIEMFVLIEGSQLPLWAEGARIGLLAFSFMPLFAFGLWGLPYNGHSSGYTARMTVLVGIAYLMQVVIVRITYSPTLSEWLRAADTISRYTLAIPGAVLAALALLRQRRILHAEKMPRFGRDLAWAATALFWYGVIGQAFPNKSIIFPSMYINSDLFRQWFGLPIQVLRASMAALVAIFLIRALRVFEEEIRRQLDAARRSEHELRIAARELSLLYETSTLLIENANLDALAQDVIERVVRIIDPLRAGLISVRVDEPAAEEHLTSYGYPDQAQVDEANRRWLSQCGGPDTNCRCWYDHANQAITDQIDSYLMGGQLSDNVLIRRLVLPLMAHQRKVGTILLETGAAGPYMTTREVPILIALTQQLAIAIENARLVLQLRERDARRALILQRTTYAQEAERKRIARELHDETGQALTALAAGLRGISRLMVKNPEAAISQIDQMQEISAHSLGELRHLIDDLRPSHLDDLGLVAALHWQVDQVNQRGNTQVSLDLVGQPRVQPSETETTLFRIAQEGLVNVLKHANAKSSRLLLSYEQERIYLCVEDDGRGFKPAEILEPQKGRAWGLIGIQERVALLGGEVSIESAPGKGSTISVSVPYSLIDRQDQAVEEGVEN